MSIEDGSADLVVRLGELVNRFCGLVLRIGKTGSADLVIRQLVLIALCSQLVELAETN